jgi:hypothetical protein
MLKDKINVKFLLTFIKKFNAFTFKIIIRTGGNDLISGERLINSTKQSESGVVLIFLLVLIVCLRLPQMIALNKFCDTNNVKNMCQLTT